jgi:hypothetical protein
MTSRQTNDHKSAHGRATGSRHNGNAYNDEEDDRMSVMTQETKFDDDLTTESGLAAPLPPEEPFDMTVSCCFGRTFLITLIFTYNRCFR